MPERKLIQRIGNGFAKNLRNYIVTYIFLGISIVFILYSGLSMNYILGQLISRLTRNAFIILALIIPIIAGMGINFAITIGAMAAQISLMLVINWGISGIWGILAAAAMTVPLGTLFGYLIGTLLNKMKGQETIGSLILGYFANGAYQLLFLFIFGNIIPLNESVTITGATGVKNTLDLMGSVAIYGALDGLWRVPFGPVCYFSTGALIALSLLLYFIKKINLRHMLTYSLLSALLAAVYSIPIVRQQFVSFGIPIITLLIVGLLCLFNVMIMRTRLGQKFRAVGQNRVVANAAGIHVDHIRIIAITISTVLAGWGQIIFLQNMGTLQTYAAHEQVGLYAGAAILVGGASIDRATNGQAMIGCLLFHTLFIVAQNAAANLFGDSAIGEFFRVFLSYGVIAVALVMYAWRGAQQNKPGKVLARAGKE